MLVKGGQGVKLILWQMANTLHTLLHSIYCTRGRCMLSWWHTMTSSNRHNFRVTDPLCGEFTGHRWILLIKASDADFWCFLWFTPWINNCEAGDLIRYRSHYDVIVMHDEKCISYRYVLLPAHWDRLFAHHRHRCSSAKSYALDI